MGCKSFRKLLFKKFWLPAGLLVPARRPEAGNFYFGLSNFLNLKPGWLVRILSAVNMIQSLGL